MTGSGIRTVGQIAQEWDGHDDGALTPGVEGSLAAVIEAGDGGGDLTAWLRGRAALVEELLLASGAVLFRGFAVADADGFGAVTRSLPDPLLEYTYRSTARTEQANRIFTSTEYPADQEILMHNENSYATSWPARLWFCCLVPAADGGATPLADSRAVLRAIDPGLRARVRERGVLYVRNYSDFVDLPWREVFQTSARDEVERYCRSAGIAFDWRPDGGLTTRQVAQGVTRHRVTGEPVWFNQAHLFHPSGLPDALREALLDVVDEDELPRQAFYGDGTPFATGELAHIRDVYREAATDFGWRAGDVLLVDNVLVAHGRRAYAGPRKVLVAMAGRDGAQGEQDAAT
jgi:alpha-ketoglutarate-dependent taurine dioxygenase